jgi:hypothetical protein
MSYNGSGTFQINTSGQPVVAGTVISATAFNALTADLATGLSTAITKDGQTTTTARIPFAAGISSTLTTDSSSVSTGSIITSGGVGIAKALNVGSATDSSSISTGSIVTAGGVGVAKALYVGTTANVAGAVTLQSALSVTGVTTVQAGTAAAPAITTTGDTNTGIFFPAADTIAFSEGGTEAMRIDSSGNLLVGTTSTDGRITANASTSNASSSVLVGNTSAGNTLIRIRADGLYNLGLQTNSPYNFTSTGANAILFSDGTFGRATSSLKYKRNVETATHGLSDVLKLRSVTYKSKNERDGETIFGGLIAEEVHEIGLTEFVQYAEDGTPDSLYYANMVSLCIKAIQEQQALITTLTDRITALEAK